MVLNFSLDAETPRQLSPTDSKPQSQPKVAKPAPHRRAPRPPRVSPQPPPPPRQPARVGAARPQSPRPGQYSQPQDALVLPLADWPHHLRLLRIAPLLNHEHHWYHTIHPTTTARNSTAGPSSGAPPRGGSCCRHAGVRERVWCGGLRKAVTPASGRLQLRTGQPSRESPVQRGSSIMYLK